MEVGKAPSLNSVGELCVLWCHLWSVGHLGDVSTHIAVFLCSVWRHHITDPVTRNNHGSADSFLCSTDTAICAGSGHTLLAITAYLY